MYFMAIFYIIAGVFHFIKPDFYLPIMPRYLPYHLELVYLSGLCEIICGFMLVFKRTQSLGAWLTIALLIAVCKCICVFIFFESKCHFQRSRKYSNGTRLLVSESFAKIYSISSSSITICFNMVGLSIYKTD
jgi:hypothetical protein